MYKVSVLLTDGLRLVADPGALDPAVAAGAAAPLLDAVPGLLGGAAPHLLVAGVPRVVTCNVDCLESMLTALMRLMIFASVSQLHIYLPWVNACLA